MIEVAGQCLPEDFGSPVEEARALLTSVGLLDLCHRGRFCLLGADRKKFLHGQVTQHIERLKPGTGAHAALVDAKGKLQADLWVHDLGEELLVDLEPGIQSGVQERLEKYIIAEDVELVDVSQAYGMLSLQGPLADRVLERSGCSLPPSSPDAPREVVHLKLDHPYWGEVYIAAVPRLGVTGRDLFVPVESLEAAWSSLENAVTSMGGKPAGWSAMESTRLRYGIPRFGQDMNESNLAPETGMETTAIAYDKGCYIGQEVIARIRTYGKVARHLRTFILHTPDPSLPLQGAELYAEDKKVGQLTTVLPLEGVQGLAALGYIRKEQDAVGSGLRVGPQEWQTSATQIEPPFALPLSS